MDGALIQTERQASLSKPTLPLSWLWTVRGRGHQYGPWVAL